MSWHRLRFTWNCKKKRSSAEQTCGPLAVRFSPRGSRPAAPTALLTTPDPRIPCPSLSPSVADPARAAGSGGARVRSTCLPLRLLALPPRVRSDRTAEASGRGCGTPCPELEPRGSAVALAFETAGEAAISALAVSARRARATGIVTRKGRDSLKGIGFIDPFQSGSVSEANRARPVRGRPERSPGSARESSATSESCLTRHNR